MRLVRSIIFAAICMAAFALASGCDMEKVDKGQGIRASVNMYPTADTPVDPRASLGYYYYFIYDNTAKYEIDFDLVPDWSNIGDNNYMTLRGDYLRAMGETNLYLGGGGGLMLETLPNTSDTYLMVEGVVGYMWPLGNPDDPFLLDLRITVQYVLDADNAPLVVMGTLNYEF